MKLCWIPNVAITNSLPLCSYVLLLTSIGWWSLIPFPLNLGDLGGRSEVGLLTLGYKNLATSTWVSWKAHPEKLPLRTLLPCCEK